MEKIGLSSRFAILRFVILTQVLLILFTLPALARTLVVTAPNGGEWFEPGETVQIRWSVSGTDWQGSDTVKLEYSDNGGASWSKIQGANRIDYNAPSYSWSTSGLVASYNYRIRITCNADSAAADMSDANFKVGFYDTAAPTITHTPYLYTNNAAGPYSINANITDNRALAGVTLYWSKNGSAFASAPMAATGSGSDFEASIPGPSNYGDEYRYYIEAKDASLSSNTARSPSGAPGTTHWFSVTEALTEMVGGATYSKSEIRYSAGNQFYCSATSTLTGFEQYLNIPASTQLTFSVYEYIRTEAIFFYSKVAETTIPSSGTGLKWYASGPMSVRMLQGHTYLLITTWSDSATYYYEIYSSNDPLSTSFLAYDGGYRDALYPAPASMSSASLGNVGIKQRLTSYPAGRGLAVTYPNEGEFFEPGNTIQIKWNTTGSCWKPTDTVKLMYSSNKGSTWYQIPGATNLPCNAGSFDWNVTGYQQTWYYYVKVVYTDDPAISDTCDSNFKIMVDNTPPYISHYEPLKDTTNLSGPYKLRALATDDYGVTSATIYWSKNGSDFTAVPMELESISYHLHFFRGEIPGPAYAGDRISYYIEAKDKSYAGLVTRNPEGAPNQVYSFNILRCGTDIVGYDWYDAANTSGSPIEGNEFICTIDSELTQIEQYFDIQTSTELRFVVYESSTADGLYTKIHETVVPDSGTGSKWYSSGTISVPMKAGKYYGIAAGTAGLSRWVYSYGLHPVPVCFGNSTGCFYVSAYPPPQTTNSINYETVYYQRLTACRLARTLTVTQPNSSIYELGSTVEIKWKTGGIDWRPADTLKLEYSSDGGATWNLVPGAENVAYNAESFSWDTAGCLVSDQYKVKTTFNGDSTVNDSSDSSFALITDNAGPVITHTAFMDTNNTAGPYKISALVTDNLGVGQVTLYWNKNGGAFITVPMTASAVPNEYAADIPGPSLPGDSYCYYIEAVDTAQTQHISRSPAEAPGVTHRFNISACRTDYIVKGIGYSQTAPQMTGNVFSCDIDTTLSQIEAYLSVSTSTELKFLVYESETQYGQFNRILETTLPSSGTGTKYYSSGPISARLLRGRYYIIATAWQGDVTSYYYDYYGSSGHPIDTVFGQSLRGYYTVIYPPSSTVYDSDNRYVYPQKITSCPDLRDLVLDKPAGGSWHEPGDITTVRWSTLGVGWRSTDTVKLEYSANSGSTWNAVPGAGKLAYDSGQFDWDTDGLPEGDNYRVKVSFNGDPSEYDTSNPDFIIRPDTIPPVITHTPLTDNGYLYGPYEVTATITDNYSLDRLMLYWSKNGGAYQSMAMAWTGTGYEFSAEIPGPSAVGDTYCYYIAATDRSNARNRTTDPAGAPDSVHCFTITACGVDDLGGNSTTSTANSNTRGNIFECNIDTHLTQIEQYLQIIDPGELRFSVYECTTAYGAYYSKIFDSIITSSGTGEGWYSSGPISVWLTKGKYYMILCSVQGTNKGFYYYHPSEEAVPVTFGKWFSGFMSSYFPSSTKPTAFNSYEYKQRLTTCREPLVIAKPNGGDHFEAGNQVQIQWRALGLSWQPTDTVQLEYSSDGGSTWNQIPGAEDLSYNAGIFAWDTTNCVTSSQYRVKVAYNGNANTFDVSDADFSMMKDTTPPVIIHTPCADTYNIGSYQVKATVTDDYIGVGTVTLYWNKNDGSFSTQNMSLTAPDEYTGYINTSVVVGDVISYYIVAKDKAAVLNEARNPAEGVHSFRILPPPDRFTQAFGYSPYTHSFAFDLQNLSVTFTPDGSYDFYSACTRPILSLPIDPAGGTQLALADHSFAHVTLTGEAQVSIYGSAYNSFYIGSSGYVTFTQGDTSYLPSAEIHMAIKRISGLFDNLVPSAGGTISWKQLEDRAVITFHDVPAAQPAPNLNTFQIEMFYDGRIRLSYLNIGAASPIVGLSEGKGWPKTAPYSDLSEYPLCAAGQAQITDSILPAQDAYMPYGMVNPGATRNETAILSNTAGSELIVKSARLGLFAENFDDNLAQDWLCYPSQCWSIDSGEYACNNPAPNPNQNPVAVYKEADFDNFYYEANTKHTKNAGGLLSLLFRATSDFRVASPSVGSGYIFGLDPYSYSYAYSIRRQLNGTITTLASGFSPLIMPPSQWNTLAVNAVGSTLQFYVNGSLLTTLTDSNLTSGKIGLIGPLYPFSEYDCRFDEVFVAPPLTQSMADFGLTGLPTLPALLLPGQSLQFGVNYTPLTADNSLAALKIGLLGADRKSVDLHLTGTSTYTGTVDGLKTYKDGTTVAIQGLTVTAVFDGRFYVQENNGICGIGMLWNGAMPGIGDTVSVVGVMTTQEGERLIQASDVAF